MEHNQLQFTIPCQIGFLTHLTYLNFAMNQIGDITSDFLPKEIFNLTKLQYFSVKQNNLRGWQQNYSCFLDGYCIQENFTAANLWAMPPSIASLTSLTWLDISSNFFSSTFSNEIGKFTHLVHLVIRDTKISGTIPADIGLLSELKEADFSHNRFSGGPPPDLSKLTMLQTINFQSNFMNGSIECNLYPNISLNIDCLKVYCKGNCICHYFDISVIGAVDIKCPNYGDNSTPALVWNRTN